jgi:hypothetical protein
VCECVCVFGGLFVVVGECARVLRCSRERESERERVRESRQNEEDDNFALLLLASRLCHFFHIIIITPLYGNFNFPTFAKI